MIWSDLKGHGFEKIGLTFETFIKILDCYYGSIFVTDGKGVILYFNESFYANWGLSREKYLGKNVSYFSKQKLFTGSGTMECLKRRKETAVIAKDKTGRDLLIHAVPIFDDNDNILYTVQFGQHESSISTFLTEIEKNREQIKTIYGALEHITKNVGDDGMTMVYQSETMTKLCNLAKVIAKTDSTVILYGESGTGKEVMARYIYQESNRAKEVFIPVNCAAIPGDLMESEFFGYVPGAFTGAQKEGKLGLFELGNHGTLFLDEIGELPLLLQSKLLRVLETGEVSRLGATFVKKVDVRIIAATNRDLKAMIKEKTFREDLYYRLDVMPLTIPPLRERTEDIEILSNYFLQIFNKKYRLNKKFSNICMQTLKNNDWPGNIRELKNLIHRLVITTQGDIINTAGIIICTEKQHDLNPIEEPIFIPGNLKEALCKYEMKYIQSTIVKYNGNVTKAAEKLGVHRTFIYRKMKEYKSSKHTTL